MKNYIVFEGSFELTPYFQQDVDAFRRISPRFIAVLLLSLGILALFWFLANKVLHTSAQFSLLLGGLLLGEAVVHLRHSRNLSLALLTRAGGDLTGKVE